MKKWSSFYDEDGIVNEEKRDNIADYVNNYFMLIFLSTIQENTYIAHHFMSKGFVHKRVLTPMST